MTRGGSRRRIHATRAGWMLALVSLCAPAAASDRPPASSWVRELEIRCEPEQDGQSDYTVRIRPGASRRYDRVLFECVYHQEFPWEDLRGRSYTKIHEPVRFTYRRADVKLVNDLDAYISFRVPVGHEQLRRMYGPKVFNDAFPVSVPRMRITAVSDGAPAWSYEVAVPGAYDTNSLPAPQDTVVEPDPDTPEDPALSPEDAP